MKKMENYERDTLWQDIREQARIAGVDPDDPTFLKHASQAPAKGELYDQVTHAINQTREEKYRREEAKKPVTIEKAIEAVQNENVFR
jgi:hypothetical protein